MTVEEIHEHKEIHHSSKKHKRYYVIEVTVKGAYTARHADIRCSRYLKSQLAEYIESHHKSAGDIAYESVTCTTEIIQVSAKEAKPMMSKFVSAWNSLHSLVHGLPKRYHPN